MTQKDTFSDLARFYDPIMREIDYDRWLVVSTVIAELCGREAFSHIDLACGTGNLLKRLIQHGWGSTGIDISHAMLREARKGPFRPKVAAADLCHLPFGRQFHYATCVFDSLNFLLESEQLRRAFQSTSDVLLDDGVFYFDVITERMVTEHFADMNWTEDNGSFSTTWKGSFDRASAIADIRIRINTGPETLVRERVYSGEEIRGALEDAGLVLLGEVDSETWREPTYRTTRLDMVAVKSDSKGIRKDFEKMRTRIRGLLA